MAWNHNWADEKFNRKKVMQMQYHIQIQDTVFGYMDIYECYIASMYIKI